MHLRRYLGQPIEQAFNELRRTSKVIKYSKIEGDEFIILPELGFFLHARDGSSIVSGYRVYFENVEDYFPASDAIKSEFSGIDTIGDLDRKCGKPIRAVPSIRIPGLPPTLPGSWYRCGSLQVAAHYHGDGRVSYIHVEDESPTATPAA